MRNVLAIPKNVSKIPEQNSGTLKTLHDFLHFSSHVTMATLFSAAFSTSVFPNLKEKLSYLG